MNASSLDESMLSNNMIDTSRSQVTAVTGFNKQNGKKTIDKLDNLIKQV